jgi:hypothetical protein
MKAGRLLAWVVGLVLAGMVAIWLVKTLLGLLFYLVVGALVVGGGVYLYYRAKHAIGPGARARRRIEAAVKRYRPR